jgi:hypothetical protein
VDKCLERQSVVEFEEKLFDCEKLKTLLRNEVKLLEYSITGG